eukprot:scaffold4316_cov116-Isochrysis_galbana.AAC.1
MWAAHQRVPRAPPSCRWLLGWIAEMRGERRSARPLRAGGERRPKKTPPPQTPHAPRPVPPPPSTLVTHPTLPPPAVPPPRCIADASTVPVPPPPPSAPPRPRCAPPAPHAPHPHRPRRPRLPRAPNTPGGAPPRSQREGVRSTVTRCGGEGQSGTIRRRGRRRGRVRDRRPRAHSRAAWRSPGPTSECPLRWSGEQKTPLRRCRRAGGDPHPPRHLALRRGGMPGCRSRAGNRPE